MKKIYTKPNMKIVSFQTNSVITLSGESTAQTTDLFGTLTINGVTYNSDK
ncbi:MAG: hypothetical protein LIO87_08680 [Eubacterium sp.]|nr:hypothetical protein [Eubacterium sp.]